MKNGVYIFLCAAAAGASISAVRAESADPGALFSAGSVAEAAAEELDGVRGREGLDPMALGRGGMSATLSNSTAVSTNVTTYNVIESGAFADANGIVSVIQNTGNNVIIQDSTVVNVNLMR
jgi:hypothetical protein